MRHSNEVTTLLAVVVASVLCVAPNAAGQAVPAAPTPTPTLTPTPSPTPTPSVPSVGRTTYMPCRQGKLATDGMLDVTRRDLYETLCGASLWLDGLFGRHGSLEAAERINGRAELSVQRSDLEGTKVRTDLDVNFRLPHLENRLNAFIGRSDPEDYVRDRQEGFGLRSQFVDLESREKWLTGLGYSLPGSTGDKVSLRAGVTGGIRAIVFGQAVYRDNIVAGERDMLYLQEVAYWKRGEGYGFTSSADWDHVVTRTLMLRWGTIGTISEGSHGLDWRTALLLYQNLHKTRALAYEVFARGVTETLGLTEFGGKVIYRQSAFRPWFFVDLLTGYSWLRLNPGDPHRGTSTVGIGGELWFGPTLR